MREIIGVTANIMLGQDNEGNWKPKAEVILIANEPHYHLDEDFEVKKRRHHCEVISFLATDESINDLLTGLEKVRFELQSQSTAANLANQEKKAA